MTKEEATEFFAEFYFGEHHIPYSGIKEAGYGWKVAHNNDLSTYDFNALTRLVIAAHDKCYRVSVMAKSPKDIWIIVHKRESREGHMTKRHPTMEDAIDSYRNKK